MRKALIVVTLLMLMLGHSAMVAAATHGYAQQRLDQLDKIVAVVNDDVITKSELNRALVQVKAQATPDRMASMSETVLQKQVLDQLINRKLQLQISKQIGITISKAELDKTIASVAVQNNMSVEALYTRLSSEGMSVSDYRNEMRDQLTLQRLQQQEVVSHIAISPQEVTNFIRSSAWRSHAAKEYHLEDILVPLSDAPSSAEVANARKQADILMTKLNLGRRVKDVLLSVESKKESLQTTDLGWRKLPEIPSAFTAQVVNLSPNELAGPIQTGNGFHIVRLVGVRELGGQASLPDRKQVEELLLQRKFEEAVQNWVSRLRSQAYVIITPT